MIGKLYIVDKGNVKMLAQVDLLRFNEEQIRSRLVDKGYAYDSEIFIGEITDWNVSNKFSLAEIKVLKLAYEELYDGDEYVLVFLLKKHVPLTKIASCYYRFLGSDEVEALATILKNQDAKTLCTLFFKCHSWVNLMNAYMQEGILLATPKGYYLDVADTMK